MKAKIEFINQNQETSLFTFEFKEQTKMSDLKDFVVKKQCIEGKSFHITFNGKELVNDNQYLKEIKAIQFQNIVITVNNEKVFCF